jgi:serine phosphatase RsbU (regulator of sigma subunit)
MMSDGVSDGGSSRSSEDSRAFLHYLKKTASEEKTTEPHIMSRLLMERAADSYRGRERDDLTVMVARLC